VGQVVIPLVVPVKEAISLERGQRPGKLLVSNGSGTRYRGAQLHSWDRTIRLADDGKQPAAHLAVGAMPRLRPASSLARFRRWR
jgi:hypothetical protein